VKPADDPVSAENGQSQEKKKYRKPSVQLYGSLAEGTKSAPRLTLGLRIISLAFLLVGPKIVHECRDGDPESRAFPCRHLAAAPVEDAVQRISDTR